MTAVLAPPCADNPELFFSEQPEDIKRAQQTCAGCRQLAACQDDVMAQTPPYGVWAGINFTPPPAPEKTCPCCEVVKTVLDFHKNSLSADGRDSQCTDCRRERDAARQADQVAARRFRWERARELEIAS